MSVENPLLFVRPARPADANELLDIDIKCFDTAWTSEDWSRIQHGGEHAIVALTYFGSTVGFVVYRLTPEGVQILKLAVKQNFRRHDGSKQLLAAVRAFARERQFENVFIIVPENMIYNPEITRWLIQSGFKATVPFLKDHFQAFGETEDGVKCVASSREG